MYASCAPVKRVPTEWRSSDAVEKTRRSPIPIPIPIPKTDTDAEGSGSRFEWPKIGGRSPPWDMMTVPGDRRFSLPLARSVRGKQEQWEARLQVLVGVLRSFRRLCSALAASAALQDRVAASADEEKNKPGLRA